MTWLTWFSSKINKAVVAALGALASWAAARGIPIDWLLSPADIQFFGAMITAYLVWRIPNEVREKLAERPPL